jgi:hypothetical protein
MTERFVSEPIRPAEDSFVFAGTPAGEPPVPQRFTWRDTEYTVAEVLERRRETGPCTHGSGELYARKHWFRVRTTTGEVMNLYFERHARSRAERKKRWWLYSVSADSIQKRG